MNIKHFSKFSCVTTYFLKTYGKNTILGKLTHHFQKHFREFGVSFGRCLRFSHKSRVLFLRPCQFFCCCTPRCLHLFCIVLVPWNRYFVLSNHINFEQFWPEACNFINKETLAQVFSCEFCGIFENTFFTVHPWTTASSTEDPLSLCEPWYLCIPITLLKHWLTTFLRFFCQKWSPFTMET